MMWETVVHKFSDGTLTKILEKMDHMVKDYELFKFNPGMEHRIWSEDDKVNFWSRVHEAYREKAQDKNRRDLPRDNPLVSVEVLSCETMSRRFFRSLPVLRTASAAAKSCQGDSSEFYLITGSVYTD
ncbi:hypothetical protein Tco_0059349 [Tanacetum coccineum]